MGKLGKSMKPRLHKRGDVDITIHMLGLIDDFIGPGVRNVMHQASDSYFGDIRAQVRESLVGGHD